MSLRSARPEIRRRLRTESQQLVDRARKKIETAYKGIQVTAEGEAKKNGRLVKFLEYAVGVSEDGKSLRWFHWNKNTDRIAECGEQKFLRLKHWRSGTAKSQLMGTLRTRLDDIAAMTRNRERLGRTELTGKQRGSGSLVRDTVKSVRELMIELSVSLGYRMRDMCRLVRRMSHSNQLWADVLPHVQAMRSEFEEEQKEQQRRRETIICIGM